MTKIELGSPPTVPTGFLDGPQSWSSTCLGAGAQSKFGCPGGLFTACAAAGPRSRRRGRLAPQTAPLGPATHLDAVLVGLVADGVGLLQRVQLAPDLLLRPAPALGAQPGCLLRWTTLVLPTIKRAPRPVTGGLHERAASGGPSRCCLQTCQAGAPLGAAAHQSAIGAELLQALISRGVSGPGCELDCTQAAAAQALQLD